MIPVDPKPFQKINKTVLWTVLFVLICLCGYSYFFNIESASRDSVVNLTKETASLRAEESESSQIKNQLSSTDAQRLVLVSYFVDAGNPVPFEETIEGYGTQTNTKVLFQGLSVNKNPNRLDVSFGIDGNFVNIYRFLALLESAPYELSINNLDLQTADPSNIDPTSKTPRAPSSWHANVSLSIYSVGGIQ